MADTICTFPLLNLKKMRPFLTKQGIIVLSVYQWSEIIFPLYVFTRVNERHKGLSAMCLCNIICKIDGLKCSQRHLYDRLHLNPFQNSVSYENLDKMMY